METYGRLQIGSNPSFFAKILKDHEKSSKLANEVMVCIVEKLRPLQQNSFWI